MTSMAFTRKARDPHGGVSPWKILVSTCYTASFVAAIGTSGRERKMSEYGAVIHDERRRSLPRTAARHRLSASQLQRYPNTQFMIPLEETSQAGFCFSAMNG